jgi:hypothetical protein
MPIRYKLTDEDMTTFNNTQWAIREWKETSGGESLCGPGWLHCYTHPLLAAFLNRGHRAFQKPRLFECVVAGDSLKDGSLKEGWTEMELVNEMELPKPTLEQFVRFGILCALTSYKDIAFATWANNWLNGINRTEDHALAARSVASHYDSPGAYAARAAYYFAAGTEEEELRTNAAFCACYAGKDQSIDFLAIAKKAMETTE